MCTERQTEREGGRTQAKAGDGEEKRSWQAMKQPRSPWRLKFIGLQLHPAPSASGTAEATVAWPQKESERNSENPTCN